MDLSYEKGSRKNNLPYRFDFIFFYVTILRHENHIFHHGLANE